MNKAYEYSYEQDATYCYPDSNVLRNKLNILDSSTLFEAEREITSVKIAVMKKTPLKGKSNFKHLQDIHQYIFGDIYDWAGEIRTVNIAKGNQFCNCMYIVNYANDLFRKLHAEKYLLETKSEVIAERFAYYLSEINVMHPFREGNGRTQRVFIEYLAQVAGYRVDFTNVSDKEMIEASALAFACKYEKINDIFLRITLPLTLTERKHYINYFEV